MKAFRLLALSMALALALAGCARDCVACRDAGAGRAEVKVVVVNLCASEVPDPEAGEGICAEPASINYAFVGGTP